MIVNSATARQQHRDHPEPHDDLLFGPAAFVEVVVDRRDLEDAFAVAQLERADLQDHGEHLEEEHPADDEQQELLPSDDREVAERPASASEPVSPMKTLAG